MDDAERSPPPEAEVQEMWERTSRPLSEVPDVAEAWAARKIDVEAVEKLDLARALRQGAPVPSWASSWVSHRLIVPMYDAAGKLSSVHARRPDGKTKALSPADHAIKGLVFANPLGLLMLEGKPLGVEAARKGLIVAEGVPDFLTLATCGRAVLGVISGSWSEEVAERVPAGARVLLATHDDAAGDRYAEKIRESLGSRCGVLRAAYDWNDLLKADKLPADPFSLGKEFPAKAGKGEAEYAPSLDPSDLRTRAWAAVEMAAAVERVENEPIGGRNQKLNSEAFRCFQMAGAGLLEADAVDAAFLKIARTWEPEELKKAVATLKSARKGGLKKPLRDDIALIAGDRPQVRWNDLDRNSGARAIERHLIEKGLYRIDQTWVRVCEHDLPYVRHVEDPKLPAPKQLQCLPLDQTAMLLGIEEAVCLVKERQKGGPKAIPVPVQVLPTLMLELPDKVAPQITGLVQHPILMPDGRLIESEGYDEQSGLYLAFDGQKFPAVERRPSRKDAVTAAKQIRKLLFPEIPFRDPKTDGAALLALFLTGIARKVLQQAPAGLITATVQGTGKTTAARMLWVVLSGRDMVVQSIAPDKNEFQKAIFATLIRQSAMVCFDNLADGTTLDSPELARIITSPMYEGRILGLSKVMTVPTNTLIAFTGNSITVGADLARRIIKVDLLAKEARPEQHRYEHPEVVRYVQSVRLEVIANLLTIQRAWACSTRREGQSFGCGPQFDRLVAWPLAFAGEEGLFAKREELAEQSPDERAKTAALLALAKVYGVAANGRKAEGKEFTATEAIRKMGGNFGPLPADGTPARELRDAVEEADPNRVKSADALGRFFGPLVDQPPREGLRLQRRIAHGITKYHVEGAKERESEKGKLG